MSQQTINIGSSPNDSTGDPLRTSFQKINSNFNELYANVGGSNFKFTTNTLTTKIPSDLTLAPVGNFIVSNGTRLILQDYTASTNYTTGALVVTGGVGITGDLNVSGSINSSSLNLYSINNIPIGNATPSTGAFSTLSATTLTASTINSTNIFNSQKIRSSDIIGISSGTFNYVISNTYVGADVITANTVSAGNVLTSNAHITGGNISGVSISITALNNTPIGNGTPNTGAFTTMTASNAQITGGNITGVTMSITALNNTPIGNATPSTGNFTILGASGIVYANNSTTATSTSTGALRVVGGVGIGGNLWADIVHTGNNGAGTNFRIGDDAWLGDINQSNAVRLMGVQDNTKGYIVFGNADTATLGRSGTGALTYTGAFIAGNITGANISAGNIGNTGANLIGTINTNAQPYITSIGNLTSLTVSSTLTTTTVNATTVNANLNGIVTGTFNGTLGAVTPNTGSFTDVTITGNLIASTYTIHGNISGSASTASSATTAGTATYASTSGLATAASTVVQGYQGNITGTGTLANLYVTSTITGGNLYTSGNVNATGNITTGQTLSAGTLNVGNVRIVGGNMTIADTFTVGNSWGSLGDVKGKILWSNSYVYVCGANYTGTGPIWFRANLNSF